jgi:predicted dehydrogenase
MNTNTKIKVLVVGLGNMGTSHALAYHSITDFEVVGLVDQRPEALAKMASHFPNATCFNDYTLALKELRPDAVCIATYPDTHASLAIQALQAGAHVFVEKPLAKTVAEAKKIVVLAKKQKRKVVVGYILRHHPAWMKFIELARTMGKPLVMRMNLNQQSSGPQWATHKNLLQSMSPIVDCGVHYIDVMCQMTRSKPIQVQAIGARLTNDIKKGQFNYGQLQVFFADGSVGWYECGWGPMMSEVAFFVKDVVGPKGCVSIVEPKDRKTGSSDIDSHTKTNCLCLHRSDLNSEGKLQYPDEYIDMSDEPNHQELCNREQRFFLQAIRENLNLKDHLQDAINSLGIVLAADQSARTKKTVKLRS